MTDTENTNTVFPTGTVVLDCLSYQIQLNKEKTEYLVVNKEFQIVEVTVPQFPAAIEALLHFEKAIAAGKEAVSNYIRTQEFSKTAEPEGSNVFKLKH